MDKSSSLIHRMSWLLLLVMRISLSKSTSVDDCRQTVLPAKWVIVDDGSTDRTAEIVANYAMNYPWIELVSRP